MRPILTTRLLVFAVLLMPFAAEAQETDTLDSSSARIFFATNRDRVEIEDPQVVRFGGQRGSPSFGTCEIEFKPIPILGDVASRVPFYVPSETSEMRIEAQESPQAFWDDVSTEVESTSTAQVVLFVHGYSFDFERGCERAAEVQRSLAGTATVLMFTWPSNGEATDYVPDLADLEWSVPLLAELLELLANRFGPSGVHVLSHSLGARGVMLALSRLRADLVDPPVIGRWVLLAPDIDSEVFVELLPRLGPMAESITLYASSNDTPLKVSRQLNGSPRLGQAGELLTVAPGMETIDVSPAGRYQILGHEYFFFHPAVAADLAELLSTGKGSAERSALSPQSKNGLPYWEVIEESEP
ncbi:MAG: alpha/beta fold hydrolase [Thermoanaerobaculia bacterium]